MTLKYLYMRVRMLALAIALCLSATACQTMGSVGTNRGTPCLVFKPIYWSKQDTRDTQNQIVEHNAVYQGLCLKDNKNK